MARVLRIPCHDNETSFVLVHVDSSTGGSSRPLDLTLVATEGTSPYIFTLKQSKISSLKAKNGPCTQDEWSVILESILLCTQASDDYADLLQGVETVASVQEKEIDITIRKRTEGITQRLGTFSLAYDESQEIELFEWCGIAVQSTSNSANELASFKSRFRKQQETISKLNAQLEELIAAKAAHEAELLEKFRDLLNEKKAKIRDQQRLLATAKVDPKKLAAIQASRKSSKKSAASSSRTGKRKAENGSQMDEDEDDEFEKMDVDVDQVPNDSDQQDIETPDEDETETADEDDDEIIPQTKPPAANTKQAGKSKGKPAAGKDTNNKSSGNEYKQNQDMEDDPPKTPPRRELPFAKKNKPQAKPPVEDDEETASEDDEL